MACRVLRLRLWGGSHGASSRDVFSLIPVPEIHWLLSGLLAFLVTDDTFLSFFLLVLLPSRVSSHGICCILQATMDMSLPSFIGYFEKRAG